MDARSIALASLVVGVACGGGPQPPAALDTSESCRHCRMAVSDPRFAGQIVARGEEPAFFDDVGCLGSYVSREGTRAGGAIAYVMDHRTEQWVPAAQAVYTRVPDLDTPMGSHLIAHADSASRDADPVARRGVLVRLEDVFGPSGPPRGSP